jgi:hypothetical protein
MNRKLKIIPAILVISIASHGCKKYFDKTPADTSIKVTVSLESVSEITLGSAIVKGFILMEANSYWIGAYSVDYDTSFSLKNPLSISHSCPGRGVVTVTLTDTFKNLKENTRYYARIKLSTTPINPPGGDPKYNC